MLVSAFNLITLGLPCRPVPEVIDLGIVPLFYRPFIAHIILFMDTSAP
jgi:hypothetical protein